METNIKRLAKRHATELRSTQFYASSNAVSDLLHRISCASKIEVDNVCEIVDQILSVHYRDSFHEVLEKIAILTKCRIVQRLT